MVDRPLQPFDGERTPLEDGDFLLHGSGRVYRLLGGWYLTSYSVEVEEMRYTRGRWYAGRRTLTSPETTLKVLPQDVERRSALDLRHIYSERYASGAASQFTRDAIAEHKRQVRELGLPRDG